jgi:hypothetical protein
MLSICTTVKNRSLVNTDSGMLRLFPKCIESIVGARTAVRDLELVIADWESDDWPLADWLCDVAGPVPIRLLTCTGKFSRGRGLNAAAAAALGNKLFFIDADALVRTSVLRRGVEVVQQGKAYFPILYSYTDPQHRSGYWRDSGFGHCMVAKQVFEKVGGWPEYTSWGLEDNQFCARVAEHVAAVRERAPGLFHQWHPDDIDFKNRYGEETSAIRETRARTEQRKLERRLLARLQEIIPASACCILVDEDRTDIKDGMRIRPVPFLERGGQYWGPPADDEQAIGEMERLRRQGAQYIVFPWVAFWWLEHYESWVKYLSRAGRCLIRDELVVVYELLPSPEPLAQLQWQGGRP